MSSNFKCCAPHGAAALQARFRAAQTTVTRISMVLLVSCMAACSSMPGKTTVSDKLALQEKVDERMAAAEKALKQGQTDQALGHLDGAIRIDPAAKQPWLKKAQIHFDARQYGLAITEAQEVLQRDVRDLTAQSILAVSGLRVSAQALEQLRKVNEVNGSTRSEAESVARIIHEALGEPILVPNAAASASPQPGPSPAGAGAPGRPRGAVLMRPRPAGTAPLTSPQPGGQPALQVPSAGPLSPPAPAAGTATTNPAPRGAEGPGPAPSARTNPFGALQ